MSYSAPSTLGGGGFLSCILEIALVKSKPFWKARLMFGFEDF
jgi:hypothetical protein